MNPDVTVRARGVMEKCTYCVQRIERRAHRRAHRGPRRIGDGELKTACQQACPTEAIVFGSLNDPDAQVTAAARRRAALRRPPRARARARAPRYLARITNPNPELRACRERRSAAPTTSIRLERRAAHRGQRTTTDAHTSRCSTTSGRSPAGGWSLLFLAAMGGTGVLVFCHHGYTLARGIGVWGNNIPVGWAFGIINFVWWIGIGHAGTLISAILLLFQQKWRTSINRFAEAMTLFAVMLRRRSSRSCTSAAPGSPTGSSRTRARWASGRNSRAPLVWDVFADLHLLHGLAALLVPRPHPRPRGAARRAPSAAPRGSSTASSRSAGAARRGTGTTGAIGYLLLAGLATPLVLSVHTIVASTSPMSLLPGLAHHHLPALLRRRRHLLRLRDGDHA